MAKVIQFKRKKKQIMSAEEYIDGLNTVEFLVQELCPERLEKVRPILNEMRLGAHFNAKFREQTKNELLELIDDLYARTQGE